MSRDYCETCGHDQAAIGSDAPNVHYCSEECLLAGEITGAVEDAIALLNRGTRRRGIPARMLTDAVALLMSQAAPGTFTEESEEK